jgi:hypothetical protein
LTPDGARDVLIRVEEAERAMTVGSLGMMSVLASEMALRPSNGHAPSTDWGGVILVVVFGGVIAVLGALFLIGARQRRAVRKWPRVPAVMLSVDRIEVPGENLIPDNYLLAIVAELRPEGKGPHRVELRQSLDRHLEHYWGSQKEMFVRIDPRNPANMIIDEDDLWARKKTADASRDADNARQEAAAEREAAEKRARLVRGD